MSQFPAVVDLEHLDPAAGFRLVGAASNDSTGASVSSVGDINGDGFADFIVGAPGADPDGVNSGSSFVVLGSAASFGASVDLTALNGTDGFRLDGAGVYAGSGWPAASAGDVNGDGFADIVVGSSNHSYVVFGSASGFSPTLQLSTLDGNDGFSIDGTSGTPVASAGDFNGDGFADLIIGNSGRNDAYIVFGKADGFSPSIDVSSLDGNNGFDLHIQTYYPNQDATYSIGGAVASAGDVNGDGFDDILLTGVNIGEYDSRPYTYSYVYLVYGDGDGFGSTVQLNTLPFHDGTRGFEISAKGFGLDVVSGAGDINGDGFADFMVADRYANTTKKGGGEVLVVFGAASMHYPAFNGVDGFRIVGDIHENLVGSSLAGAGDVNGDGFSDLILTAPGEHAAYVIFGKASGFTPTLHLSTIDGSNGFKIDNASGTFYPAVSSAGDINGDGLADILIGMSVSAPTAGYVLYGQLPDTAVHRTGTVASQSLVGGDFKDKLSGVAGDDVLYGHGGADHLKGGLGADTLIGGGGRDDLLGGAGADLFKFGALSDSSPDSPDVIGDLSNKDRIDLSAIDADSITIGNQAFHLAFVGDSPVGEIAVVYHTTGQYAGFTTIKADVDGDSVADMIILIVGDHHDFTNFIL